MSERLSAFALEEKIQVDSWTRAGESAESIADQLRTPKAVLETFDALAEKIRVDQDLTAPGRASRMDEARATATTALDKWAESLAGLDAQIDTLRTSLVAKLADGPMPSEAEIAAMARRLDGFDQVERGLLYATASPRQKRAMELAAEHHMVAVKRNGSVAWEPLVDPEAIQRQRDAQLRDLDPAITASVRRLERRRGVLKGLGSAARSLIRG